MNITNFTIRNIGIINKTVTPDMIFDTAKQICLDVSVKKPMILLCFALLIEIVEPYLLSYVLKNNDVLFKNRWVYLDNKGIFMALSIVKSGLIALAIFFLALNLNMFTVVS